MQTPNRGDVVLYTLPKGQTRTAFVLGVSADQSDRLTLAVYKEKSDDFALPPNAPLGPEVMMGNELGSPIVIVGNAAQGDKPCQWTVEPVAAPFPAAPIPSPAPIAAPAPK